MNAKPTTRRQLLKNIGIATGAALLDWKSFAATHNIPIEEKTNFFTPPKPITAITLGAGARGNVYGNFAYANPDKLDIIGVAEPIAIRNERYTQKHKIVDENRFPTWEDVFKRPKFADAIIITTPDNLHYGPCMAALEKGYDVLLEKPIAPTEKECRDILALAKKKNRIVALCHVLRYAPYFRELKSLIQSGKLGKVVSMQHIEPIHHIHMSHSYVRGNWHNSKQTTPIILAKSCHDLDIVKWMLEKKSKKIQAFGSLSWFNKNNAPAGSTDRCNGGCAVESTCPYSALKIYQRERSWIYVFDLPEDKNKWGETIDKYLTNSNYGRCVYKMDNDQPDHYTTNILFEEDVTVAFSMEAFTSYDGRRTRVMGSLGDVVGDMTKFTYTDYLTGKQTSWESKSDGHGGGDWRLAEDFVEAVAKQDASLLSSTIDASIESHIMGFAAEKSRKAGTVEKIIV